MVWIPRRLSTGTIQTALFTASRIHSPNAAQGTRGTLPFRRQSLSLDGIAAHVISSPSPFIKRNLHEDSCVQHARNLTRCLPSPALGILRMPPLATQSSVAQDTVQNVVVSKILHTQFKAVRTKVAAGDGRHPILGIRIESSCNFLAFDGEFPDEIIFGAVPPDRPAFPSARNPGGFRFVLWRQGKEDRFGRPLHSEFRPSPQFNPVRLLDGKDRHKPSRPLVGANSEESGFSR